jgi:hypothetical protein
MDARRRRAKFGFHAAITRRRDHVLSVRADAEEDELVEGDDEGEYEDHRPRFTGQRLISPAWS